MIFLLENECSLSGGDTQTLIAVKTSMHSGRMRTTRLLTASQHTLHRGEEVCLPGGGVSAQEGCVCPGGM